MEPTTLGQSLWLLSPDLLLTLTALVVLAADLILSPRGHRRLAFITLAGLAGAFAAAVSLWGANRRLLFVLTLDSFALTITLLTLVATALVVLLSEDYLQRHGCAPGPYYALLLFSALAMSLLGAAANLIVVFLVFDFLSIVSYILTAYARYDRRGSEAAFKYFVYGSALSSVMLFGFSWIYGATGTTDMGQIAQALGSLEVFRYPVMGDPLEVYLRPILMPALVMVAAGLSFKGAVAPFHQWAPDAYAGAPTPVTAFISVGPKIAVYAVLTRLTLTLLPANLELATEWRALLMILSVLTMAVGNLVALLQDEVKRMLAYSSIGQAGYILMAVAVETRLGVAAVLFYLGAYAVTNLGAFAVIVALSDDSFGTGLGDYAGLYRRAPWMAFALLVHLLSLAGVPFTVGFMGKLWIFSSVMEAGYLWLAALGVVNSVISLGYYWKLIRPMYMEEPAEDASPLKVTPWLTVALVVTTVGVVLLGLVPGPLFALAQSAAGAFFP